MSFFDLHLHPTVKPFLANDPDFDPWHEFTEKDIELSLAKLVARLICSKASFPQLLEGNSRLAVIALHPLEKQWAASWIINKILARNTPLDEQHLKAIEQIPDGLSYAELLDQEFDFLWEALEDPKNRNQIQLISSMEQFDDSKLNLVLSIEGAHSLAGKGKYYQEAAILPEEYQGKTAAEQHMLSNLYRFKNHPKFSIFHLTFTHHAENELCSQAFGMPRQMLGLLTMEKDHNFKMQRVGILGTKDQRAKNERLIGEKIARLAWDQRFGNRILLDVKHMSLQSRRDLYDIRRQFMQEHSLSPDALPLIASHTAATGLSYLHQHEHPGFSESYPLLGDCIIEADCMDLVERKFVEFKIPNMKGIGEGGRDDEKTTFNSWSINLYNDDIVEIVQSYGMMGIIMDKKGVGTGGNQPEYFSVGDFQQLFPHIPILSMRDEVDEAERFEVDEEDKSHPSTMPHEEMKRKAKKHLRHFCNNLLHIAKVGGRVKREGKFVEKAVWDHLCIGSDFDGFINPIFYCNNVKDYDQLEVGLINTLPDMALEGTEVAGTQPYFFDPHNVQEVKAIARKIMYENGKAFLEKYFNPPVAKPETPVV